jgi:Na+-translocating ferredoxin:NAD+ oxidoreductase subunit B
MEQVYQKLADELDRIPNGFPKTQSGVELKLLAKLFSPREARLASTLSLEPQSIKTIADNNNQAEAEVKAMLIGMVKKGLIEMKRMEREGFVFYLMPFVVGFYEKQNAKIDKEFAELFETYYKETFHITMTAEPSVHRIIPIEKSIPVSIDVMPYEKASTYLDEAKSWGVLNCICRVQQKLIGQGCDHPVENCLVFSTHPGAFDRRDEIRSLSKEEALEVLAEADREGLVHSTNNAQDGVNYICNCCTCSCGVLRGIVEYGNQSSVARSDFYALVDEDLCNACEDCIDRCMFDAIEMDGASAVVDSHTCYGCGLCITSCETSAISLLQKSSDELTPPPLSEVEWRERREKARHNTEHKV